MLPEALQLATPFLRLAARAWGPPDGLRILALHGWLDNAASFDRLAPRLPECQLVALDLPGHGYSDWRPAGMHYHFVDFVPDVVQAADALGWERFCLLGHSLGASIACFTAATVPERIERLMLIEGIGPFSAEAHQGPGQLALSMRQMSELPQKAPPVYATREQAIAVRQAAGELRAEAAVVLTERNLQPVPGGFSWRTDPALTLKSPIYLSEAQVLGFLAAIQAPTLLLQATRGYPVKRLNTAERIRQIAKLEIKLLSGGHHLHMDEPAVVAEAIRAFLGLAAA